MMIRSLCNTCLQPFVLVIQASDMHLVKQIADLSNCAPCPRLCGGRINLVGDPVIAAVQEGKRLADPIELTGTELYQAVCGAGLPDEIESDPLVVRSILTANKIVDIDIEETGGKVYINELKLENGLTIHLGGGMRARVVKITKERAHGVSSHP